MDWAKAEELLEQLTDAYTQDELRKIAFNREVFPLRLKYDNGDRSPELYGSILQTEQMLMRDIWTDTMQYNCRGFFINSMMKPTYAEVVKIVGKQEENWNQIFHLLKDVLKLKVSFDFYGAIEGWVLEFNKAGKLKVVLVPDKDNFKISIPEVGRRCFDMNEMDDITRLYPLIDEYVKTIPG